MLSLIPVHWRELADEPPFMAQIDPFDEYEDHDPSAPPDPYKEPSTWHPFLRVLTHQGTVVSLHALLVTHTTMASLLRTDACVGHLRCKWWTRWADRHGAGGEGR